jgi:hypothetical protein
LLDQEDDMCEAIEAERRKLRKKGGLTSVTPDSFAAWKERKAQEQEMSRKSETREADPIRACCESGCLWQDEEGKEEDEDEALGALLRCVSPPFMSLCVTCPYVFKQHLALTRMRSAKWGERQRRVLAAAVRAADADV